ncbi:MAG: hypothetical protein IT385_02900 [Deltaproteobacteria bacterium]|nr:hypothetical protein [Deltaproteobacteria bacterium]
MRALVVSLAIATTAIHAPSALAEDAVPDSPAATPTRLARARDASIDRGFLTAHAETIGEGKWAFNAYELIFIGLTYGFTDDIQASISTLLPIVEDIPLFIAIQPKFVLMRSPETIVSLRTPVTIGSSFDSDAEGTIVTFGAGVLVDQRLDAAGRFAMHAGLLASGAAGGGFDLTSDFEAADGAFFELDLGVTLGVASILKLLFEVQALAVVSEDGFEFADFVLFNYGVRFFSGSIAGDLGFIRPIGIDTDELILGVPYLAFSARF